MHPRQNGKFHQMKRCAMELLEPEDGELATGAAAFDVITFCSGAWSWAASYAERLELLRSSQVSPPTTGPQRNAHVIVQGIFWERCVLHFSCLALFHKLSCW